MVSPEEAGNMHCMTSQRLSQKKLAAPQEFAKPHRSPGNCRRMPPSQGPLGHRMRTFGNRMRAQEPAARETSPVLIAEAKTQRAYSMQIARLQLTGDICRPRPLAAGVKVSRCY